MNSLLRNNSSPEAWDKYRSCWSKFKYPTIEAASKVIRDTKKSRGRTPNYYQCKFCSNYHLTRQEVVG